MKTITTEQTRALLFEARKNSTRDWCIFLLTFRHALRSQEVRQLRLADVDLEDLTLKISRVKGSRSGVQSLDRHRGEPVLDEVLALRSWLKERVEDGSQVLFNSQKGGMMTRMQLNRLFKKYALSVGVPAAAAHVHVLRHTLCSSMAAENKDVYEIQRVAGHRNISNTAIYLHISDSQANDARQSALMSAFAK